MHRPLFVFLGISLLAAASVNAQPPAAPASPPRHPALFPIRPTPPGYSHGASVDYGVLPGGYGYWTPGGYEGRIGSPYYYSPQPRWYGSRPQPWPAHGVPAGHADPYACCGEAGWIASGPGAYPYPGAGMAAGGYGWMEPTVPWNGPAARPYDYHFGPGYYRAQEYGHYRFPYYSYRRPWYFPGHPSYNRDTNFPW